MLMITVIVIVLFLITYCFAECFSASFQNITASPVKKYLITSSTPVLSWTQSRLQQTTASTPLNLSTTSRFVSPPRMTVTIQSSLKFPALHPCGVAPHHPLPYPLLVVVYRPLGRRLGHRIISYKKLIS